MKIGLSIFSLLALISFSSYALSTNYTTQPNELEYTSNSGISIVFFSPIATSSSKGISLWKGLKIRKNSGIEQIVIDSSSSETLISDASIGKNSVCRWSTDFKVFLLHTSLTYPEQSIDEVNVLNCLESPLLGIDIQGSEPAVYGNKKGNRVKLASINNCKGSFTTVGHDYGVDVPNSNGEYETIIYKLIRELFLADYNKVEAGLKKGNNKVVLETFPSSLLNDYLDSYPVNKHNLPLYNNLGYYFEQQKSYPQAITLLTKVVAYDPERTVAYINLGDAYWGLKNLTKAKEAYNKYIDLMKKSGKETKIPQKVLERVK